MLIIGLRSDCAHNWPLCGRPRNRLERVAAWFAAKSPRAASGSATNRRVGAFAVDFGINLSSAERQLGALRAAGATGKPSSVILASVDLRPPTKLSASSISGFSSASGQQLAGSATLKPAAHQFCLKSSGAQSVASSPFGCSFYSSPNSQYSQPPTADLLGTGYSAYQAQQHFHSNMYHPLTMRPVWQPQPPSHPQAPSQQHLQPQPQLSQTGSGSGSAANDAGFYLPLSQTGRSDSGSLYERIY